MSKPEAGGPVPLRAELDGLRREAEDLREELERLQRTHAKLASMVVDQRNMLERAIRESGETELKKAA